MFATRNIHIGELILTERPLTLTPTYLRTPEMEKSVEGIAPNQRKQVILDNWERLYLQPLFSRLDPQNQTAFMELANCHLDDGVGPILGVIRTNGLDPVDIVDPVTGDGYAAVCKTISRINHSCSPSADTFFDIFSFTFQLRATQDIGIGEEILISYCELLEPASVRQEDLADWGFTCLCRSCLPGATGSDQRRLGIKESMNVILRDTKTWPREPLLRDSIVETGLHWISMMEAEGLEASEAYKIHLDVLLDAYKALGDEERAAQYRQKLGFWCLVGKGRDS